MIQRPVAATLIREVYLHAGASVWQGLRDEAREQGLDLIVILGGVLGKEGSVIYDLVGSDLVSGVVNWSASDANDFLRFFEHRLPAKPMICITLPVDHHPVVHIDAKTGIREAVRHMVEVHHCRKFLCIQGRQTVTTFRERYEGFMLATAEFGIASSDIVVVEPVSPEMSLAYGEKIISVVLDDRKLVPGTDFQAVFGPSENVVLGMLRELRRRGVNVPLDVGVVSFDNSFISRGELPRLTAVVNPLSRLAATALGLLRHKLNAQNVPNETVLQSELVINDSCGCESKSVQRAGAATGTPPSRFGKKTTLGPDLVRDEVMLEIGAVVGADYPESATAFELASQAVAAFADWLIRARIHGENHESLTHFDSLVHSFLEKQIDLQILHDLLSLVETKTGRFLANDAAVEGLGSLIGRLRVKLSEAVVYGERAELTRYEGNFMRLRDLIVAIAATFEFSELCKQLTLSIPTFGIQDFYIVLHEDQRHYEFLEPISSRSWLRFALHGVVAESLPADGLPFSTLAILPETSLPKTRLDLTIVPLVFKGTQLGYFVTNAGPLDRVFNATIASALSNVIQGDLMMRAQQTTEGQLATAMAALHSKASVVKASSNVISDEVGDASAAMHEVATNIKSIAHLTLMINDVVKDAVQQSELSAAKILQLDEQLQKIGEFTAIIADIAERTNVLSINAGIQAGRAAEAGRGFSVIAQEIRQLAEGTSRAAQTITRLIKQANEQSGDATSTIIAMSAVVDKVESLSAQIQGAIDQQTIASEEISARLVQVADRSITISEEIADLADH